MKATIRIIQVFVGVLFIISGLVKANDPLSLAYKMEEFFQLWSDSLAQGHFFARGGLISLLRFLTEHQLFLSILMITLEIVAGVALLVGWLEKTVLYLLLSLIIFFSFLTGYAYLSGKFTNCGCFGDCLPISPLTSFTKDLILLIAILLLIIGRKYVFFVFQSNLRRAIVLSSLLFSLMLQWYVLNYLPLVDCLPLKKGNNISEQIRPPANAIPSVYETRLVYENAVSHQAKEMSNDEFNSSKIWEDKNWKWKETKTKLVNQGTDVPKLHGFSLTTREGNDVTDSILNEDRYTILYWADPSSSQDVLDFDIMKSATEKSIGSYFITTHPESFPLGVSNVLACDGTVFRIAARVNPTIYLIKKGIIINKWPLKNKEGIIETLKTIK